MDQTLEEYLDDCRESVKRNVNSFIQAQTTFNYLVTIVQAFDPPQRNNLDRWMNFTIAEYVHHRTEGSTINKALYAAYYSTSMQLLANNYLQSIGALYK